MPEMASCVPVATGVLHPNGPSHVEVIPCRSSASQTFIPVLRFVTRLWLEGLRVCCCEDPSLKPPQIAGWLFPHPGYPGRKEANASRDVGFQQLDVQVTASETCTKTGQNHSRCACIIILWRDT